MTINFGVLQPIQPGKVVANLPVQNSSGGIGGALSGLASLGRAVKGVSGPSSGALTEGSQMTTPVKNPFTVNNMGDSRPRLEQIVSQSELFNTAQSHIGLMENNPVLQGYLQKANPGLDPATTPWCAGYVGSVLNASGLRGTGSLAAKSYLDYGNPTDTPSIGDIVVLNRTNDPKLGHVGFYAGTDKNGMIKVLGGNQNNGVSIKSFNPQLVAGYRVPPTGQQVQQFAQKNGLSNPEQIAQLPNYVYHPELQATLAGIQGVETPGMKDPYTAIGPRTRSGDRAYGFSQIMGKNIPSWTKEATGRAYSPQEYLANPDIQRKTTEYHLNKMLQKYGTPQDAASVWFTGRPLSRAGNPSDGHFTNQQYQREFSKGYLQYKNNTGFRADRGLNHTKQPGNNLQTTNSSNTFRNLATSDY